MTGLRRLAAVGLAALVALGCSRPDSTEREVESIKVRTGPPGARMTDSYPLRREHGTAGARWELQVEMTWDAYADWVIPRLSEYRLARRDHDGLYFTRQLEGDVYAIELKAKRDESRLTLQASFEARPF